MSTEKHSERVFAGIGSRNTPLDPLLRYMELVKMLGERGWIYQSGGADGPDRMGELAMKSIGRHLQCRIWLPEEGFNRSDSPLWPPSEGAYEMAERFHTGWHRLDKYSRMLHARNCHEVLGGDLKTPVDFILCYTLDGKASGGTGQALRIAKAYNIPVFNLFHGEEAEEALNDFVGLWPKKPAPPITGGTIEDFFV